VTGSLKFDALDQMPAAGAALGAGRGRDRVLRFFRMPANRPVFVAGSTLKGEEEAVIRAFNRVRTTGSNALLILAARHPERFAEVERLCRQEGLATVRRTALPIDTEPRADAVVLDTIGELAQVYQLATAVFVGGSLVPAGGHNILEPALFGKPIIFGPHMQNFAEIGEAFLANGAAVQVHSERELVDAVVDLMNDPVRRAKLGAAARALIDANRGAKDRTLAILASLLPTQDRGRAVVRPFRVVH
jgi:3-deoxy-D-manno-octulosonic-acid transferase